MYKYAVRVVIAALFSWLLVVAPTFADLTGDLSGTVTDSTGATVNGARVTIQNLNTGQTRIITTGESGEYSAPQLEIGNYRITVEKDGFKSFTQNAVVRSGEKTRVDIGMQLGNVSESVVVESGAIPTLDVATAQVSNSINSDEAMALPNQARDPVIYATLSPGTAPVSINNPFLGAGSFNSNGSRGRANNITLDGVTATDISTTGESGAAFVQDAVAEVKVITNNFDAEFGRNSGSQVQILTKSGTNDFHGSVYDYFQNSGLGNARGYFTPEGGAVPKIVQNQGGATIGGPVIKNHTFFFASGEVERTAGAGQTVIATVLTPAQAAAITNPTDAALFAAYGSPTSPTGSLAASSANTVQGDVWTVRVDQVLRGGKDGLFVKYGQAPSTVVSPGLTFIDTNLPGFGASSTATPRDATVSYTAAISNNLVNNFRFGFGRVNPQFPVNSPFPEGPEVTFGDGTSNFGTNSIIPQGRTQNTFQYADTVSWTHGKHTLKWGVDFNRYQAPSFFDNASRGVVSFNTLADFQDGNPVQYQELVGNTALHNFALDAFGFVQDDFRITRTLTLNLGFRLESSGGVSEGKGQLANLDPNNTTPIGVLGTGPLGGVDLGGTAFHRNWNPAPRLGFAWNPMNGKLVVRGGYGIAYDFIYQNPITNLRFSPPFVNTITVTSFTGGNTLANLVAGSAPAQAAAIAGLGAFNPLQSDFGAFAPVDQNLANPRNQQWDAGVEYQLASDLVMKVTYVGARSDRLQVSQPINLVNPANIPAAPTSLADQTARLAEFQSAFLAETGGAFGPLNNLIDPRFDAVTQVQSTGTSSYNSLQVEAIRRFKNGLTFNANYTWAHSIDDISDALGVLVNDSATPINAAAPISANRANSEFDLRNRFVASYNYELPFGNHFSGWKKYLLGGWSQSGIFTTQGGFPVTIAAAPIGGITDLLLNGTNNGSRTVNDPVNGDATQLKPIPFFSSYVVPTTLPVSEPLLEQVGTSGRNHLRLDGLTDFDAAVSKRIRFTEHKGLEIRWESFNVLNHPNFSGYQNQLGGALFNTYTSTATNARQMQLSARFTF